MAPGPAPLTLGLDIDNDGDVDATLIVNDGSALGSGATGGNNPFKCSIM